MKKRKILLCGGGTGGHVLPLVAVARAIKKLSPGAEIYFVGPEEFSLDPLREEGVAVKKIIAAGKMRRYFSVLYIWELIKLPFAFIQALITVALINPDVVLGKGSYGSVLPVIAAEILFKKIILHESDYVPGLANKFLSNITDEIAVAFQETKKYFPDKNVYVVGNPIRTKYLNLTQKEAGEVLDINTEKPVIFISGGSQGAQKINNIILDILPKLTEKCFVIWSTGSNNYTDVKHWMSNTQDLKIIPLLNEKEMAAAYVLTDLAIGRAGAGTIFELAAFGKPSILIPLERKGGDQPLNAAAYAASGGTLALKESKLTPDKLIETVDNLINNKVQITAMAENAKKFAKIEAAEHLAQILLDLAK